MDISGTTQNNDESSLSENQTQELSHGQTNVVVSSGAQNANDNDISQSGNLSSNVNNILKSNTGVVPGNANSYGTDTILIQSPKLLKNANVISTSSSAKGLTNATNNDNNDNNSAIGGSFLKNLFEINGPTSYSIKKLADKYQYLPYYTLFSILTAYTGRESVEHMLEWMRHLQAKQVAVTEGLIKSKEYVTKEQFSDAYENEDDKTQLSARAGISPSGSATRITTTLPKCVRVFITIFTLVNPPLSIFIGALSPLLKLIANTSKDPSIRAKFKEVIDLFNLPNAYAEIVVMIAELFTEDEEELEKVRLIARIVMGVIYIIVMIIFAFMSAGATIPAIFSAVIALVGLISGISQIVQASYTLSKLEKQKEVAEKRLKLETAIAYCEKLQKDLDIIASEIDMIVELFTAAMDKIRAEYDRISRMIKETSDVKNMIARNIGA